MPLALRSLVDDLCEVVVPENLDLAEGELIPSPILSLPFLRVCPAVSQLYIGHLSSYLKPQGFLAWKPHFPELAPLGAGHPASCQFITNLLSSPEAAWQATEGQ